ncbi:MAG: hypothetical protein ABI883_09210, partial [Chthoniobacterales bacterium]
MQIAPRPPEQDFVKGMIAGIAGGLLASFLMEQFQALWSRVAKELPQPPQKSKMQEEPATVQAAEAISGAVLHAKIPQPKKAAAGAAVHYAMGASSGAIYGLAAELTPLVTLGEGLA